MRIGLIAGSGVEDLCDDTRARLRTVTTHYGEVEVRLLDSDGREVVLLPRHGRGHTVPPHRINYRANIRALVELGCSCVLATNAVGSMNMNMAPGDFVIVDQFLDFTRQRPLTFFDGEDGVVRHVDMSEPYCPRLRAVLWEAGEQRLGTSVHWGGTYVCCEGPRFESPAEIRMFQQLGADVVGMTGIPELVLAREAGLCYATVCVVSNWAAGISDAPITHEEVVGIMDARQAALFELLRAAITALSDDPDCACHRPFG
ncbi:MAG: S-methyl-5'-thioadenosine phosphorylase [Armatimonadota bacterium]